MMMATDGVENYQGNNMDYQEDKDKIFYVDLVTLEDFGEGRNLEQGGEWDSGLVPLAGSRWGPRLEGSSWPKVIAVDLTWIQL